MAISDLLKPLPSKSVLVSTNKPHPCIMKWFRFLTRRLSSRKLADVAFLKARSAQHELIGKMAKTLTPLRTSGLVELDGKKVEVTSAKGYVAKGTMVRIIGKRMGWWLVEPV